MQNFAQDKKAPGGAATGAISPPKNFQKGAGLAPGGQRRDASSTLTATLPEFHVWETKVCAELGVSKDELRRRREHYLHEGKHWAVINKRVLLSVAGAEILRGTAHLPLPAVSEKKGATADCEGNRPIVGLLPERCESAVKFEGKLVVWAASPRNAHLVVAYVPGTDPNNPMNLVSLMVRDNRNFLRGMEVPGKAGQVRRVSELAFELVGQCPRYRGRW